MVALPDDHRLLVNSSAALRAAIEALPPTAPVLLGLSALNRSRDALPPLIDAALASIAYYDETGDDSDMSSIGRAAAELQLLLDQVENPPDDAALRAALAHIEARAATPPPLALTLTLTLTLALILILTLTLILTLSLAPTPTPTQNPRRSAWRPSPPRSRTPRSCSRCAPPSTPCRRCRRAPRCSTSCSPPPPPRPRCPPCARRGRRAPPCNPT